jgi:peptidoglycan/LPS O-acetylase OafA/YrhL
MRSIRGEGRTPNRASPSSTIRHRGRSGMGGHRPDASGSKLAGPTIAAAMRRPHNNFTAIRLALALAVIVSHAFSVTTGVLTQEPLALSTGFTLGEHAVNGFFALSGFLVTMSLDRRGARDYALARFLRIAPGLVVATLVTALVLGAALTRLPLDGYYAEPGLWRFVVATLTSFKSAIGLPGVFAGNPLPYAMGTVWTLKYEALCYLGVLAVGVAGLVRLRMATLALAGALFVAVLALDVVDPNAPKAVQTSFRLFLIFALGGALYVWRDTVRLSGAVVVLLAAAAWASAGSPAYKVLLFAAEAYGVIWLALAPRLSHVGLEPGADLSYGTYLYGWPVQQALVQLFPAATALALLGPAIVMSLGLAALSWYAVEKPALALKSRFARVRTPIAAPQPA